VAGIAARILSAAREVTGSNAAVTPGGPGSRASVSWPPDGRRPTGPGRLLLRISAFLCELTHSSHARLEIESVAAGKFARVEDRFGFADVCWQRDAGALGHKFVSRREADATRATGYQCNEGTARGPDRGAGVRHSKAERRSNR
jgi:hypothetical protein